MRYVQTRIEDNEDGTVTVTTDANGHVESSVVAIPFEEMVDGVLEVGEDVMEKNIFDQDKIFVIPTDPKGI